MAALFLSLNLWKILPPSEEEEEGDEEEEEEEIEEAEEGEVLLTEMPALPMIEEVEPAAEAPPPTEAKVVVPTEDGGPAEGSTEVPSSSWA